MHVGKPLRLVFHITATGDKLSGTFDSPDQGATGFACKSISIRNDSILIDMSNLGIRYKGLLKDAGHITGVWLQAGRSFPLDLAATDHPTQLKWPPRPQTPRPPFSYISKNVVYRNKDKSVQYGATITMPKGKGPFPALLLITGSGMQNRDEELFGHKPFAVIADYLTKKGYLIMRVDDRGTGQSTGEVKNATTADFAIDVKTSLDYLESLPQADRKKTGLLGHSEGGLIAEMVASRRRDVSFIILLAAPGIKIARLMEEQKAAIDRVAGIKEEMVKADSLLYSAMVDAVITSRDSAAVRQKMEQSMKRWREKTSPDVAAALGITNDDRASRIVDAYMKGLYDQKWAHYFLHMDPQVYLKQISCKVLALNGEKDIQVLPASNLEGIRESLTKSSSKDYEVKELKGLNHLFQDCKTCKIDEYGQLEETISPAALDTIAEWLDENVK